MGGACIQFLILESAQAGLSWATILKKRAGYAKAFESFDYQKVAEFSEDKITELTKDPSIVRNRLKIEAAVNNARRFMEVQSKYGTFTGFMLDFVDGKPVQNAWNNMEEVPSTTELSNKIAKELERYGFKFLGSTNIYAHMQATGIINDHLVQCYRHQEVKRMAK